MMELLMLSLVGFLCTALGLLIGRYVLPTGRAADRDALGSAQVTIVRLEQESISTRAQLSQLEAERDALTTNLKEQSTRLTTDFENIANRILKLNAKELSDYSTKSVKDLLDPLQERIKDFREKVEKAYDSETREVISLKEQIKLVMETSNALGGQADGLAKALRGDPNQLGSWGELTLARILTAAGLTEGLEYVTQGRGLGLRNEDGRLQKPDVVVNLPEQRTMVIDSKVSLASYDRLIGATDEDDRKGHRVQLVKDVKAHIDDLSKKRYQENEKLQAHDCVLMFVPIESALATALSIDAELFIYAWDRRVVLVGSSTLLMTMRTVASIWRYQQQGQNAQEIAKLAGDLCDKVRLSLTDFTGAEEKIRAALDAHNEAVKRLSTGRRNVLAIGDRMRELGVETRRLVQPVLIDGIAVAAGSYEPGEDQES